MWLLKKCITKMIIPYLNHFLEQFQTDAMALFRLVNIEIEQTDRATLHYTSIFFIKIQAFHTELNEAIANYIVSIIIRWSANIQDYRVICAFKFMGGSYRLMQHLCLLNWNTM